jgi:hypothetical protein
MGESETHAAQVNALASFVRLLKTDCSDLVLYHDLASVSTQKLPGKIQGFRPDLLARFWKTDVLYIGEGKTTADLETAHTRAQMLAFARELKENVRAGLILCAPFEAQPRARALLWNVCSELIARREVYCIYPGLCEVSSARLSARQ